MSRSLCLDNYGKALSAAVLGFEIEVPEQYGNLLARRINFDRNRNIKVSGVQSLPDTTDTHGGIMTIAIETQQQPRYAANLVLLLVLATLWGASYTFIKIGVATIPPVTLIAARTLIAGGVLLVVMQMRGIAMPRDIACVAALHDSGLSQQCASVHTDRVGGAPRRCGPRHHPWSNAPIFAFLLAIFFVRHEKPTVRQSLGVAAGLTGICLVVGMNALAVSVSS